MKYILIIFFVIPNSLFSQEKNYISNKDYTEFVTYVRDSLLRQTMGEYVDEELYLNIDYTDNKLNSSAINWKAKLDLNSPVSREELEPWYYKPAERLNRKREFDPRKFIHNRVKVYPDELIWCRDTSVNKSWAIFLSKYYFTHPNFQSYPVRGLSQKQIEVYIKWKYPQKEKTSNISNNHEISLVLPKEKLQFTVGDYFKFYKQTRDSIVRMILCQDIDEYKYCKSVNEYDEEISPPIVKWKYKIKWDDKKIIKTLKDNNILTSDNKINNRLIMFTYTWLKYYKAITVSDTIERDNYFGWESINLCANDYIQETSTIAIKKLLKKKSLLNYNKIDIHQLKAFYHWKKSSYSSKDIFNSFIPHHSDIEKIRNGKLLEKFYNFSISIPVIQLK